ncbi:3-hydroxybutyryl-CoA dehydrogenase [Streptomyces sp. 3MP-14]|uniref:3-hydroxybutyryl-CoA dehydrogenase n=1 Tax=Streptomyces mimosae TaxID=2586635 RepID=A0A5N6A9D7_9ACTN|nr:MULTISPECIES: 3-hydroxyacyl-CoA dehydrogenase family protein [Streptomyces]KAB8164556.1 3-hydroxybutyryl-CoA dehydrogenase [Streptomyces mimosae]KAB8175472.1 3-hydroxybutyryl-CoA dehydrogenase [Streptomyces sp. 3MP-14]
MARKLAVVGAGLMGSGIAQVAAQAGWDVVLRDLTEDALAKGRRAIETSLAKFVEKERLEQAAADAALTRISTTTDLDAVADAELVVEAVFEDVDTKRELLRTLDGLVKDEAVLASNTSAIPITKLAAATRRPDRVVGTHFFSPVPLMALCELVRGHLTSDQTLATAREFAESTGKTVVVVERDVAGFVTTRLITALVMEAVSLYESGVASAEDIDTACRLGFGHAMGPLATADLTGVDVLLHATENIHRESADGKFAPPEIMRRMVDAGSLGRKTGQGFYSH